MKGKVRTSSLLQKFSSLPQSARGSGCPEVLRPLVEVLSSVRFFSVLPEHFFAVDFVIPPGNSKISGEHVRAGVHVAETIIGWNESARCRNVS